ncbi:histidine kinase [Chryseolinea sp. T2]|uniref:sensor histidine kinase n=1 Tax=Chryseolinea sp. T2 TaxID=3129255 RepID=UPI0030773016
MLDSIHDKGVLYVHMIPISTVRRPGRISIHILVGVLVYAIVFIYCIFKFDDVSLAVAYSLMVASVYVFTGFFNCYFLMPRYYQRHPMGYWLLSVLFILLVTSIRMLLEHKLFYDWMNYRYFFNYSKEHFSFSFVTIVVSFLFGSLVRLALNYMLLLQRDEQRKSEHIHAELQLLKSQVQPHFLFNALNNIYYLSYSGSEKTTESILRLSDAMRYFVDEAPKSVVSLNSELEFIKDYIEVERIRFPRPLCVKWSVDNRLEKHPLIPPMLFLPLVENVFKHGLDKRSESSFQISVSVDATSLVFRVINGVPGQRLQGTTGTGLNNLRKRLVLLYGDRFRLITKAESENFISELTIPLEIL